MLIYSMHLVHSIVSAKTRKAICNSKIKVCIRVVNLIPDKTKCGKLIAFHNVDLFNVFLVHSVVSAKTR